MLTIDGSMGEGGGQILRSSLALSACLGRPFRITRIREARRVPGLQAQHLAAVKAAAAITDASVEGAEMGSGELVFRPGAFRSGPFHFSVGTAGSTTLVVQTVLPALLTASAPSSLVVEGGTHNPLAPPFEFLEQAFLPLVNRMGPRVVAELERPGFYPAGGGAIRVAISPVAALRPLHLLHRGNLVETRARAVVAHLPEQIAERELAVIARALRPERSRLETVRADGAKGPGNVVMISIASEQVCEVFTAFGERGVRAERVAESAVAQARRYLRAGVAVGEYLADQLLLPLALAGGSFDTLRPSRHTLTNMEVLRRFVNREVRQEEVATDRWRITVS